MSLQWWAYKHENGNVQVKRFLAGPGTAASIADARVSPFVAEILGEPFDAPDRMSALEYARGRLTGDEARTVSA